MSTIKIGKPFTPSTVLQRKELQLTELLISCGGGMGGSRWTVYTNDEVNLNDKFVEINTMDGAFQTINTRFIVRMQPVTVFKTVIRNDGNKNMQQKVGEIKSRYYLVPTGKEVEFVDDYVSDMPEELEFAD